MTPSRGARRIMRAAARRAITSLPMTSREVALALATRSTMGPSLLPGPPPGPVLVIAPHPDDEVIGPGGAVARHVAEGHEVTVLVLTSGDATIGGAGRAASDVARRREAETVRALHHLAVDSPPTFARLNDGGLSACLSEVADLISRQARGVATVYLPWLLDPHPDHRATAQAAARATFDPGTTLLGYEVWGAAPVDVLLDVTSVFAQKQAALAEYHLALEAVDYVRSSSGLGAFRSASAGLGGQGFAEGFVRSSVVEHQVLAASVAPQVLGVARAEDG